MKNEGIAKVVDIAGSQIALARRCGRAQSTICDWLNGKKKFLLNLFRLWLRRLMGKSRRMNFVLIYRSFSHTQA